MSTLSDYYLQQKTFTQGVFSFVIRDVTSISSITPYGYRMRTSVFQKEERFVACITKVKSH